MTLFAHIAYGNWITIRSSSWLHLSKMAQSFLTLQGNENGTFLHFFKQTPGGRRLNLRVVTNVKLGKFAKATKLTTLPLMDVHSQNFVSLVCDICMNSIAVISKSTVINNEYYIMHAYMHAARNLYIQSHVCKPFPVTFVSKCSWRIELMFHFYSYNAQCALHTQLWGDGVLLCTLLFAVVRKNNLFLVWLHFQYFLTLSSLLVSDFNAVETRENSINLNEDISIFRFQRAQLLRIAFTFGVQCCVTIQTTKGCSGTIKYQSAKLEIELG